MREARGKSRIQPALDDPGSGFCIELRFHQADIAANVRKIRPGKFDRLIVVLTSARARAKARALERPDLELIKATDLERLLPKEEATLGHQKSDRLSLWVHGSCTASLAGSCSIPGRTRGPERARLGGDS